MIQTLKCPSCAAPVEYEEASERRTLRCPFCNNTMFVPGAQQEDARPRAVSFSFDVTPRASKQVSRWGVFIAACVIAGIIIPVVIAGYFLNSSRATIEPARRLTEIKPSEPPKTPPRPSSAPASGFATVALKFGGEGIGPGLFKDARSIAVDEAGHIYVGEYTGGRIQVFDAEGKFLTQWMVDPEMPLRGMAASRQGTVYVVQRGKITRYEGTSGKQLGVLGEGSDFDDVLVTADGGLVTAQTSARSDDIVVFDAGGRAVRTLRAAISGQSRRSELQVRVAADGVNNIYALGTFNDAVFKFAPDGRFMTRFGGRGNQPGQFRAPLSIAVDNQGRVYVGDGGGVQVFDPDGRYLDAFKVEGVAFGMDFNDQNELFVAARTQVLKFVIKKP